MGWPFATAPAPSFETGDSLIELPTVLTPVPNLLTTQKVWLLGQWIINTSGVSRKLYVLDGSGTVVMPPQQLPDGSVASPDDGFPFLPLIGLQWYADGLGVFGKLWGYK